MSKDLEKASIGAAHPGPVGSPQEASSLLLSWQVILNPCPWCAVTPLVCLSLEGKTGGTWVWEVSCNNYKCSFKPEGRHVAVRKSQRFSLKKMKGKLDLLCAYWNVCNKYKPYEKIEVSLDDWRKFIKKG